MICSFFLHSLHLSKVLIFSFPLCLLFFILFPMFGSVISLWALMSFSWSVGLFTILHNFLKRPISFLSLGLGQGPYFFACNLLRIQWNLDSLLIPYSASVSHNVRLSCLKLILLCNFPMNQLTLSITIALKAKTSIPLFCSELKGF